MAGQVISKIKAGDGSENLIASSAYFVCNTQGGTAAKIVKYTTATQTAFTPINGTIIYVYFLSGNSASLPTLTLQTSSGTEVFGAKRVHSAGGSTSPVWDDNNIVPFVYDADSDKWIMFTEKDNLINALWEAEADTGEGTIILGHEKNNDYLSYMTPDITSIKKVTEVTTSPVTTASIDGTKLVLGTITAVTGVTTAAQNIVTGFTTINS